MPIQDFELYHGAMLTALVRSSRPVTLQMARTDASDCWSTYILNDTVAIYTKYSAHGDYDETTKSVKWTFTFNSKHLGDLGRLQTERPLYIALVCGNHALPTRLPIMVPDRCTWREADSDWTAWFAKSLKREKRLRRQTGICLLAPNDWGQCLELESGGTQSIHVELAPGGSFLVNGRLHVPQNALKTWHMLRHKLQAEIPD